MAGGGKHVLTRWTVGAYACICAALVLVVLLGVWGAYQDIKLVRLTLLQTETARVRSHALRSVGHIESELEQEPEPTGLDSLRESTWLCQNWSKRLPEDSPLIYGAVVDASGTILVHSDPHREGAQLERRWYRRVVLEGGDDVVETRSAALTGGSDALDVRIPIMFGDREMGEYHEGLDMGWLDRVVAERRSRIVSRWSLVIGGILLVVLLAAISLYFLAARTILLRHAVNVAHIQRVSEIGRLAAGLAHEIRNPLHAIRLNLHALGRAFEGDHKLNPAEVAAITRESDREINRVDSLLRELLGFTSPSQPKEEVIELNAEVQAILNFLREEMTAKQVHLHASPVDRPVWVPMDHGRLRQVLLNLLTNALDAVHAGGQIELGVQCNRGHAEITVCDDGEGIPAANRERIFEPFFSTKEHGTGFGLALVKRFVDEAHGSIAVESNGHSGTTIRVVLPELVKIKPRSKKV